MDYFIARQPATHSSSYQRNTILLPPCDFLPTTESQVPSQPKRPRKEREKQRQGDSSDDDENWEAITSPPLQHHNMESGHRNESHLRAEAPEFHPTGEDIQSDWIADEGGPVQQSTLGEEVDATLGEDFRPESRDIRDGSHQSVSSDQEEADTPIHRVGKYLRYWRIKWWIVIVHNDVDCSDVTLTGDTCHIVGLETV
ncbi:hypothetical protein ILYODFUR_009743 [Ilyodon furcidens]|uniref:Uncharacterized protein n=1 Tax=Ilyodon furcidens TaxID=33524 RepID=A0ABV0U554_9TELE